MQRHFPNDTSEAAEEGTAAHWVASDCLLSGNYNVQRYLGQLSPNNIVITQEMVDGAEMYIDDILKYCNEYGLLQSLHVEGKLDIGVIYKGMTGTPDCWVYNPKTRELVVWDFKFGHGEVKVYQNPQFICYDAAILEHLRIDGISDQMLTVRNRVVQPRCYTTEGPIREWKLLVSDLRGNINQVRHSADIVMSGAGVCQPGLHCHHCTAKHACEALQRVTYDIIERTGAPIPMELHGTDLGYELRILRRAYKLLEYRLNAIETQAEAELRAGKVVPGFRVQDTWGRKIWNPDVPVDQLIMMGDLMGVDIRKPQQLDTPAQVIKKLKSDDVVKQYVTRPHKGWKVVEDDGSKAKQAFSKTKIG